MTVENSFIKIIPLIRNERLGMIAALFIPNILSSAMHSEPMWSQICHLTQISHCRSEFITDAIFLPTFHKLAKAWGKWCHNFNTCPCWIHKIITHTCHLFVMILSVLTYLHIKALIKISKEQNTYLKINSKGDLWTALTVFLCVLYFFFPSTFYPFVCLPAVCLLWRY